MLVEEVQSVTDLTMVRSGLQRARRYSRSQALRVELSEGKLSIDGVRVLRNPPGLQRLVLAMTTHGVSQLTLSEGATPRELLKLAMLLARPRAGHAGDASLFEELRDAALWSIRALPVPMASAIEGSRGPEHDRDVALAGQLPIAERTRTIAADIAAARKAKDGPVLATTLAALVAVEAAVADPTARAEWEAAFLANATDETLTIIASALPMSGDAVGPAIAVLRRAGDTGTQVMIDLLLQSDSMAVRRACFDALSEIRRGATQVESLLKHEQWFVVRNAACLLGAFRSRASEPELVAALAHGDERVRAAVVTALLELGSESAQASVRGMIRDISPEVRRRAVRGFLGGGGTGANVGKLLQALERETELEVQLEFVYTLGALATTEAVQKLIRLASCEGINRPTEFRIAVAEAVASARLGASIPVLRAMLKDPDEHARAAARHLIRAVS